MSDRPMKEGTREIQEPSGKVMLLSDLAVGGKGAPDLDDLRRQLDEIMANATFEMNQLGEAAVELTVPARNTWELKKIKTLLGTEVAGWKVIEKQSYSLPRAL